MVFSVKVYCIQIVATFKHRIFDACHTFADC